MSPRDVATIVLTLVFFTCQLITFWLWKGHELLSIALIINLGFGMVGLLYLPGFDKGQGYYFSLLLPVIQSFVITSFFALRLKKQSA